MPVALHMSDYRSTTACICTSPLPCAKPHVPTQSPGKESVPSSYHAVKFLKVWGGFST